jgi:hypothetical protein
MLSSAATKPKLITQIKFDERKQIIQNSPRDLEKGSIGQAKRSVSIDGQTVWLFATAKLTEEDGQKNSRVDGAREKKALDVSPEICICMQECYLH